jgi:hypothetical protein
MLQLLGYSGARWVCSPRRTCLRNGCIYLQLKVAVPWDEHYRFRPAGMRGLGSRATAQENDSISALVRRGRGHALTRDPSLALGATFVVSGAMSLPHLVSNRTGTHAWIFSRRILRWFDMSKPRTRVLPGDLGGAWLGQLTTRFRHHWQASCNWVGRD